MNQTAIPETPTKPHRSTAGLLAMIIVCAVLLGGIGFLLYSAVCPCERTPGGFLFGERVTEPVGDWSFANQVPLCQIQIYAGLRPHSINLNCMATDSGELFLSCSVCTTKYWATQVDSNEAAVLRLNGLTYPVVLNRVTDPARMDAAWRARVEKLQVYGGAPPNPVPDRDAQRPDHWWTFEVKSRAG